MKRDNAIFTYWDCGVNSLNSRSKSIRQRNFETSKDMSNTSDPCSMYYLWFLDKAEHVIVRKCSLEPSCPWCAITVSYNYIRPSFLSCGKSYPTMLLSISNSLHKTCAYALTIKPLITQVCVGPRRLSFLLLHCQ